MSRDSQRDAVVHDASAGAASAVTPDDTATINETRGLYVGVAGDVTVRMVLSQANVTFVAVQAGTLLPIRVDKVLSTGTSALSIVALF